MWILKNALNLTLFAWKWSWWRIKNICSKNFHERYLYTQTTADFTSRVSKSYVPFTCKFPIVMHFVPILHKRCRSKTNFYVFSYDKTSLKFCASFRYFLAVFMEKFQKIFYLSYVRRGISSMQIIPWVAWQPRDWRLVSWCTVRTKWTLASATRPDWTPWPLASKGQLLCLSTLLFLESACNHVPVKIIGPKYIFL